MHNPIPWPGEINGEIMPLKITPAALVASILALGSILSSAQTTVTSAPWGKTASGTPVELYTLSDGDITVRITTFGARVVSIETPDRTGKKTDIVLGYKDVASYESDHGTYFGSIVGRYGNRIAKGTFSLDGSTYHIPLNNGPNALHGGPVGFDHKVWKGHAYDQGLELTLVSPNGDMGFPGTLTAVVRYTLTGHALRIHYAATTTKPTVVNLTNHTYFNLSGEASGTILNHSVRINASSYTPVDDTLIPTGKIAPVTGTPFDFRIPFAIGARINDNDPQLVKGKGYDHNFVLDSVSAGNMHLAAIVTDPASGRVLSVNTTEPGVQFYSGNFLDGTLEGISGTKYVLRSGFCLETQHFPDSPNQANFPSTVLRPKQKLESVTIFTFDAQK